MLVWTITGTARSVAGSNVWWLPDHVISCQGVAVRFRRQQLNRQLPNRADSFRIIEGGPNALVACIMAFDVHQSPICIVFSVLPMLL